MKALATRAPGKLNLCLYLGPIREDGLHELVSIFESVSLHDALTLERNAESSGEDRVECRGVEGENLAARALALARSSQLLTGPPIDVEIEKRVPVAAGMGGGSADAAATLRMVAELEGRDPKQFFDLAFELGADVPSQIQPGPAIVTGAGERVERIPEQSLTAANRGYVILASDLGLATGEVFRAADRLGLARTDLADREATLRAVFAAKPSTGQLCDLVENDLTPAIVSLRPELAELPRLLEGCGARVAEFTGSGPTCFGVFDDLAAAERAAAQLRADGLDAHAAGPVDAEFGRPQARGATQ